MLVFLLRQFGEVNESFRVIYSYAPFCVRKISLIAIKLLTMRLLILGAKHVRPASLVGSWRLFTMENFGALSTLELCTNCFLYRYRLSTRIISFVYTESEIPWQSAAIAQFDSFIQRIHVALVERFFFIWWTNRSAIFRRHSQRLAAWSKLWCSLAVGRDL